MNRNHTIPDGEIHELMIGFFSGTLNNKEMKRLNEWLEQDKRHLDVFNRMHSAWILWHHDAGKKNFDVPTGWASLKQRITGNDRSRFTKWITPMRYAASLALCMATTAVVMMLATRSKPVEIAGNATFSSVSTPSSTTIQMPLGSKSNVTLPDGSSVWLNAGSTLVYPADFGIQRRELQLTGEAFFIVKSDSLMPFNVHTTGVTVRALGTRFNVKAYPNDKTITATLEEGVIDVLLSKSKQSVQLKPKEQLVISKSQQENHQLEKIQKPGQPTSTLPVLPEVAIKDMNVSSNVQTELATSWKDAQWIIADMSLELLATDMERRYNLKIRFDSDELKRYKFTGIFENETVEQILTALSMAAPVNYHLNKNNVTLILNKTAKEKFDRKLIN